MNAGSSEDSKSPMDSGRAHGRTNTQGRATPVNSSKFRVPFFSQRLSPHWPCPETFSQEFARPVLRCSSTFSFLRRCLSLLKTEHSRQIIRASYTRDIELRASLFGSVPRMPSVHCALAFQKESVPALLGLVMACAPLLCLSQPGDLSWTRKFSR